MGGHGSGGANKLTLADHRLAGTLRKDRHVRTPAAMPDAPVSTADRRRLLHGLDREARRLATRVLDEHSGWTAASLLVLRNWALSCQRLAEIIDDSERRREIRTNLGLLKALDLER